MKIILALALCAGQAWAANDGLVKADGLFEKGLYQEALTAYTGALKLPGDPGLKALYRVAECESLLSRYGEAAQRLAAVKLPADSLWRGRLLLLRAETGRQFLDRYGHTLPSDEQKGTEDVTKLTAAQWRGRVDADYDALWPLRRALAGSKLATQDYFVNLKGAELAYTPTLWDFAVLRWTSWLVSQPQEGAATSDATALLRAAYGADYAPTLARALKAAAILEAAAGLAAEGEFVKDYWRVRRLMLAFEHPEALSQPDPVKARELALATLKGWGDSFSSALARAWALYHAADLARQKPDYKAAVDLCRRAEAASAGSNPAGRCAKLRAEIELPSLELAASFAPPPGEKILQVTARNLPAVYFRAYRTTPAELTAIGTYAERGWNRVKYMREEAVRYFLGRKAFAEWETKVAYPAPYEHKQEQVRSPAFKKGLYVIVASGDSGFEDGSSLIRAVTVNITDIFLLGTAGLAGDPEEFIYEPADPRRTTDRELFRLYAVNALTGRPLADAGIDAYYNKYDSDWERVQLRTGQDGTASFSQQVRVAYPSHQYFSLDPLLAHGGAYAYWNSPVQAGLSVPAPLSLYVETDRPVYRPGQEVKFKVTVLERRPRGLRTYAGQAKVRVIARDANWEEVYSKALPLTGLGSAAAGFSVPQGRLLGQYTLTAEIADYGGSFSGAARFGVEEYKRPEFEVKLAAAARPFRYGEKAEISGDVKYYFGSPVPGAQVKYRVTRSRYIPWYCWYWGWFYGASAPVEVAAGDLKAGEDGRFTVAFTPQPESGAYADYPSSYQVEAEARDAGGRTITDTRAYRAGAKTLMFDVTADAGFFTPDAPAALTARLMDLNDVQQAGQADFFLYRLEKAPAEDQEAQQWGSFGENPSLERAFSQVPDGKLAESGRLVFSKDAPAKLKLKPLAPGAYRLRLKAKDPWGGESAGELVLVSAAAEAGRNAALKLPAVALFERGSYQPGETARVLVGASALKGSRYVELLAGNFVLSRRVLPEGGLSLFALKVGREHRGGFGLRWLGAGGFRVYSAMGYADVPRTDKNLRLSLDSSASLAPGQKVSWRLKASDAAGKPVSGEALVKIFDRSLEYYGKDEGFWGEHLYPGRPSDAGGQGSLFTPYAIALPVRTGVIQRMLDAFRKAAVQERMASLRIASSMIGSQRNSIFAAKSMMFEDSMDANLSPDMVQSELSGAAAEGFASRAGGPPPAAPGMKTKAAASDSLKKEAAPEPKVRTDFSETAYYNPQMKVLKGEAAFSFRIPERLTAWKITSYLLTRDARRGSLTAETVTKKDLMVRLDIPRFFREGDVSRLTAVVTNDTRGELSGQVTLAVSRDGRDALADFKADAAARPFTVKAGGTQALYWDITAPAGTGAYKVRAVARAGRLSDAQENDLPLLPSRERLIVSGVAALDGNASKKFELPELLAPDPGRQVEALHLEIQPQLILTVLNSLPFLVTYPYECTEQLLNRYVPLAITNAFYRKYPELAAAAGKVPKRSTITPEWERDNPVRLMSLMETPWERESRGRQAYWPVTDMLDPGTVAAEKEDSLTKLKAYQSPDGSFPWFPGGHASLYLTLYVLEGLAEAARYGVDVPQEMARRALAYVLAEVPSHLKPEEEQTSLILYAAYVVTAFPESWAESRTARTYAKAWVDYADKHANAMTAFGKAYAAYVYLRLGEGEKAQSYLDRAMDGARTDDIAGVYWTPEKISWRWYNDTVEKHAFILRTLLAVRPKDPRVAGLARWLLFNRKANEWKSTKASAAAIYSLLDVMKTRGSLDKGDVFTVKWGALSEQADLKPFDWVAKPLRWSKYGGEISKKDLAPVVEKRGPGLAFASFTGVYTSDKTAEESPAGLMNVSRRYFLREKAGGVYQLRPLASGDTVAVGDQVEVHLTVNTRSQFEYVHIKDPKAAGFEAEALNSGWQWDGLGRYEEPRDSLTNFFVEWLPHGEYVLKYRLRPTTPGRFRLGAAVMQSMYAPEFAAHSAGMVINVK
ncbi:MAG: MG2 domain-containing protein [Elusimicrobiales bacterium]|nr:MG2 domain-containing protein [Elusimicrobiales bacterium]